MATISGKWVFNKQISRPATNKSDVEYTVNFVSEPQAYGNQERENLFSSIEYSNYTGQSYGQVYYKDSAWLFPVYTDGGGGVYDGTQEWINDKSRYVDFGTVEQTVSSDFITWLRANAVPWEPPLTTVSYNNKTLSSLNEQQTATLLCSSKQSADDVSISFYGKMQTLYKGQSIICGQMGVNTKATAKLKCRKNKFETDVVIQSGLSVGEEVKTNGHTFYGEEKLPTIPIWINRPYCWIRKNIASGYYDLFMCESKRYYRNDYIRPDNDTCQWFRVEIANAINASGWTYYRPDIGMIGVSEEMPVLWSSHDIPYDAVDETNIYFEGANHVKNREIEDSWAQIADAISTGDYLKKYIVGDTKTLTLTNGANVVMQIVAFDADDKADGSGKAAITWISRNINMTHFMNETDITDGGWESSQMRNWLQTDFYSMLPGEMMATITQVKKTYYYASGSSYATGMCTDSLWIPSCRELFGPSEYFENSGPDYTQFFFSNPARRKEFVNTDGLPASGYTQYYFTRSVQRNRSDCFRGVRGYDGDGSAFYASAQCGVALGFCM